MKSAAMDQVNHLIGKSSLDGLLWDGGFRPYRVMNGMKCDGCGAWMMANSIVWYGLLEPRRCTRCRNAAIDRADQIRQRPEGKRE